MKRLVFLFAITTLHQTHAAVSPYNQRLNELRAVLEDSRVKEAITKTSAASGLVDKIRQTEAVTKLEGNNYTVTSNQCLLNAFAHYLKPEPGFAGPQQFEILLNEKNMVCPRGRHTKPKVFIDYADRLEEFKQILDDAGIEERVNEADAKGSSGVIDGIAVQSHDQFGTKFALSSGRCSLTVEAEYVTEPAKSHEFNLKYGEEMVCARILPRSRPRRLLGR